MKNLDTLVQERLDGDATFQESLKDLADDEKTSLIESRKAELRGVIFEETHKESLKNSELATNYKTRAEKAEKGEGKEKPPVENKDLSSKDLYTLMDAKVPREDVDDVVEYAKLRNISIDEALKSNVVKAILSDKAETRKTAEATTIRQTRTTVKVDADKIVDDIKSQGEGAVPEKGSKEAEELFWKRRGGRRS